MSGGNQSKLDEIEMVLTADDGHELKVYIDVFDNSLSRKWLKSLNHLLANNYHLEKNYCFVGFTESTRNAEFLCSRINESIAAINAADLGYQINDHFTVENTITTGPVGEPNLPGCKIVHDKMNWLHRYFEDLQGVSGSMSLYYDKADHATRWHIRQLNLLCHEYESLVLSMRKNIHAPEWRRPSQLMCWLNAPRFVLEEEDYELFGVNTICRSQGAVYVGVNKAVGKHHWEVFQDEGRNVSELITVAMRSQTEAAGDFDIEWAKNPGSYLYMQQELEKFKQWLIANNFDPNDKSLTIGHPQVGQVDLRRTFETERHRRVWKKLSKHLNVRSIETNEAYCGFRYNWSDADYMEQQIKLLK
jgi:hypothetical protein